jgi:hypothetical protein
MAIPVHNRLEAALRERMAATIMRKITRDDGTVEPLESPWLGTSPERYQWSRLRETQRLAPESKKSRDASVTRQAQQLAQRAGLTQATRVALRQITGVVLPELELPFDNVELAGTTAADVLANPARFEWATLADPWKVSITAPASRSSCGMPMAGPGFTPSPTAAPSISCDTTRRP